MSLNINSITGINKNAKRKEIQETNINKGRKKLLNVLGKRIQQEQEDLYVPTQAQQPESEEEKYKNINDSIIK